MDDKGKGQQWHKGPSLNYNKRHTSDYLHNSFYPSTPMTKKLFEEKQIDNLLARTESVILIDLFDHILYVQYMNHTTVSRKFISTDENVYLKK